MKKLSLTSLCLLLTQLLSAQCIGTWNPVTHTSGMQNIAGINVTATSSGTTSNIACGLSGYWIGGGGSSGGFEFTFDPPISCAQFLINATSNDGVVYNEQIEFSVNGSAYPITPANIVCTPCASIPNCSGGLPMNIVAGALTPNGDDGEAEVLITGNISSIQIINNVIFGTPNGSIMNFSFQPTLFPLAANIVSFSAQCDKGSTEIKWTSANEYNMASYEIEHSLNAKDFKTLTSIPASKNYALNSNYKFTHQSPYHKQFYRLKMLDIDGTFKYSNVVEGICPAGELIAMNASSEDLIVLGNSPINVEIYTFTGQIIKEYKNYLGGQIISLQSIPSGAYLIKASGSNQQQTIKWVH